MELKLNNFYKDLLDLETYSPNEKWPSIKLIFDNLRCYPILAVFLSATFVLSKSSSIMELVAFWFLLPLMLLIFVATLVQTTMLFATLSLGIFTALTKPSPAIIEKLKGNEKLLTFLFTFIFIALLVVMFVTSYKLFFVVAKLISHG